MIDEVKDELRRLTDELDAVQKVGSSPAVGSIAGIAAALAILREVVSLVKQYGPDAVALIQQIREIIDSFKAMKAAEAPTGE